MSEPVVPEIIQQEAAVVLETVSRFRDMCIDLLPVERMDMMILIDEIEDMADEIQSMVGDRS